MTKQITILGLFLIVFAGACKYIDAKIKPDRTLAKVGSKELHLADLEGMFPEGTNKQDSNMIIKSFTYRWVKETLMMNEAELNIPKDLEIDKLVREYRSSLISNSYEKFLVEHQLDSVVNKEELNAFYENNREQYQLDKPIIRCLFLKVARPTDQIEDLKKWWGSSKKEDKRKLQDYAENKASYFTFVDSLWLPLDRIASELPKGTLSEDNVSKRELQLKDDNYQYFLKIVDVKNRRETPPISFVSEQARKFILHQRKQKIVEDKREELYQREFKANNLKIMVD